MNNLPDKPLNINPEPEEEKSSLGSTTYTQNNIPASIQTKGKSNLEDAYNDAAIEESEEEVIVKLYNLS